MREISRSGGVEAESYRQIGFQQAKNKDPSQEGSRRQRKGAKIVYGNVPCGLTLHAGAYIDLLLDSTTEEQPDAADEPERTDQDKRSKASLDNRPQQHSPAVLVAVRPDGRPNLLCVLKSQRLPVHAGGSRIRVGDGHAITMSSARISVQASRG